MALDQSLGHVCVSVIEPRCEETCSVEHPVLGHVGLEGFKIVTLSVEAITEKVAVVADSGFDGGVDVAGDALAEVVEAMGDVGAAVLAKIKCLEAGRFLVVGAP